MTSDYSNRRAVLKLLSAAAITACTPVTNKLWKPHAEQNIVVTGAGIVGAAIAYHLAKNGAQVTVIEKIAPASHATRASFAWANATWAKQPRHYHTLNQRGVSDWQALSQELGIPMRWSGSVEWFNDADRQVILAEQIAEQHSWGEPARMIDANALRVLEPHLEVGSLSTAAFSPNDAALDPIEATHRLLAAAKRLGEKAQSEGCFPFP